jgi:hypothetical protein
VVNTSEGKVTVLATHEKWVKLKALIQWLWENHDDPDGIDHKLLERKRGFLLHMVQTYPALNPYLKGVHGTLDYWRRNRDENGFRLPDDQKRSCADDGKGGVDGENNEDSVNEGKNSEYPRNAKRHKAKGNTVRREMESGDSQLPAHLQGWAPGPKEAERPVSMFEDLEDPLQVPVNLLNM